MGHLGGGCRGSKHQKSGKTTKRLNRLTPNLAHILEFIREWTWAKLNCAPRPQWALGGGGRVMWSKLNKIWKTYEMAWQNDTTFGIHDTCADSSWNGHRLKTTSPSIVQRAFGGGVVRGSKKKSGVTTKQMDRLAPNLVHVCRFIWEST